jgi:hypothetical protein
VPPITFFLSEQFGVDMNPQLNDKLMLRFCRHDIQSAVIQVMIMHQFANTYVSNTCPIAMIHSNTYLKIWHHQAQYGATPQGKDWPGSAVIDVGTIDLVQKDVIKVREFSCYTNPSILKYLSPFSLFFN